MNLWSDSGCQLHTINKQCVSGKMATIQSSASPAKGTQVEGDVPTATDWQPTWGMLGSPHLLALDSLTLWTPLTPVSGTPKRIKSDKMRGCWHFIPQ